MHDTKNAARLERVADRLDRVINIDLGERGVEHLYYHEVSRVGEPLTARAARLLDGLADGETVIITTGSVSRAWISPSIGENDGPAGAAALVRALTIARRVHVVLIAESTLLPVLSQMLLAAGVTVLDRAQAKLATEGGTLSAASMEPFTVSDAEAVAAATELMDRLNPALLISVERTGRNADDVYCSMRGVDYGQHRARIDYVFDEANKRGVPTLCVGDGGNEIGMANVADAVARHVPFGDSAAAGGAGIAATTGCSVLVTGACSNWGAYAIVAAWAASLGDARLVHRPEQEELLLQRGVQLGLINSVVGVVDARVDDIEPQTHVAVTQLIAAVADRCIRTSDGRRMRRSSDLNPDR